MVRPLLVVDTMYESNTNTLARLANRCRHVSGGGGDAQDPGRKVGAVGMKGFTWSSRVGGL